MYCQNRSLKSDSIAAIAKLSGCWDFGWQGADHSYRCNLRDRSRQF
ncbi:hypothetical protein [Chamaesiphon sp. OTE_75_metabat_556]|nr:hypothetical protein [Chamaesiphon sp. OTE_75_metabat_556]